MIILLLHWQQLIMVRYVLSVFVHVLSDNDYPANASANLLKTLICLVWKLDQYMLFPHHCTPISESLLLISTVVSLWLPRHYLLIFRTSSYFVSVYGSPPTPPPRRFSCSHLFALSPCSKRLEQASWFKAACSECLRSQGLKV